MEDQKRRSPPLRVGDALLWENGFAIVLRINYETKQAFCILQNRSTFSIPVATARDARDVIEKYATTRLVR